VPQDNTTLNGQNLPEDHRDGSIEAGYDSKETKRQIEDESDKILKRKRVASRKMRLMLGRQNANVRMQKREKKKAEKTAKERKDCGDPVEYVVANTQSHRTANECIRGGANGECSTAISSVCLISLHFLLSLTSLRSHRARNIASKRLAAASAKGMNEILGIASSASADQTGISSVPFPVQIQPPRRQSESDTPSGLCAGVRSAFGSSLGLGGLKYDAGTKPTNGDEFMRKSGKSVADYFAEKLRMRGEPKPTI